jgi:hypothetical protein
MLHGRLRTSVGTLAPGIMKRILRTQRILDTRPKMTTLVVAITPNYTSERCPRKHQRAALEMLDDAGQSTAWYFGQARSA